MKAIRAAGSWLRLPLVLALVAGALALLGGTSGGKSSGSPEARAVVYAATIAEAAGSSEPQVIRHLRRAGPPTPTPTPTPVPTGPVLETYEIGTAIFATLGQAGTGIIPTVEEIVQTVQNDGIDSLNQTLATMYPGIVTPLANGVKVDFGTGYTLPNGNVFSGSATVTYSNLVRTASQVSLDYSATFTDLRRNGALLPLDSASGSVNVAVSGGHVAGDLTGTASGNEPRGAVSVTGSAHVDTSTCAKYPTSGSVNVTVAGQTKTITLNSKCDGTFDYESPFAHVWQVDMPWPDCYTNPPAIGSGWGSIYVVAEDGRLAVKPLPGFNTPTGSGSYTASNAHLDFEYLWNYPQDSFPGHQWDQYKVTFDGALASGGGKYVGSFTVQSVNHRMDGSSRGCAYSCDNAVKPCGCLQQGINWMSCPVN